MALTQVSTDGIKDTTIATADIADDAVTADKLANSINTEIAANTAKTTNATHTGEVTGSGALTIANDAVTGVKIADDAIDSEHITDGAIDNAHIASNAAIAKSKLGSLSISNADIDANAAIAFSKLASLPAELTGSTNNTVCTVTGANTIQGEANLTFDGTTLKNTVAAENGTIAQFELSGQTNNPALLIKADESDQQITFRAGSSTSTYPSIAFDVGTVGDRLTIKSDGAIDIAAAPAKFGNSTGSATTYLFSDDLRFTDAGLTATHAIIDTNGLHLDTTSPSAANGLNDYEEGTWTPAYGTYGGASSGTRSYDANAQNGFYVKIGCVVRAWFDFTLNSWSGASGTGATIYGLPFTHNFLGSQSWYYSGLTIWTVSDGMSGTKSNFSGYVNSGETHCRTYASNTAQQGGSNAAPINVTGRISGCLVYTTSS